LKKKRLENYESILIAGASGMVGSAIKNLLTNKFKNKEKPKLLIPNRNELNYLDTESVFGWFKTNKPRIVIIAAARVGGIIANSNYPTGFLLDNLKIQNNIIEAAYKNEVERLLFLGSSCIYPKFAKQPIKEEYLLTGPLEETNESYAIAKIAGIKLCSSLRKEFGFDAISLMPTNLYGPGDNYSYETSHVMPALIRRIYEAKEKELDFVKCLGSGKSLREFLYVEDLAEACIFALENIMIKDKNYSDTKENNCHWINVGSNEEISIELLANKISRKLGYEGEILWDKSKPDGTPRKKLDSTNINNLGWHSKTDLDSGIAKTIENFAILRSQKKLRIN
tara:strand:+ start:231 stop:1244 length:1014 start_codon:yes stop_codon:yes gene_type:complete